MDGARLVNHYLTEFWPNTGSKRVEREFIKEYEEAVLDLSYNDKIEIIPRGNLEYQIGHPEFRPILSADLKLSNS